MELKGKKVLVVGLGKSGLAAALFLRHRGAQVTVSDVRSAEALSKEIPALLEEGIMVEAGGHGLLTFRRQDLIVVSPGVPYDTPELAQVRLADEDPRMLLLEILQNVILGEKRRAEDERDEQERDNAFHGQGPLVNSKLEIRMTN